MNDINFFKPYLNKTSKNRSYGKYIPLVLASILVIGLIFYQFTLSKEKTQLTEEIASIESEINDSEMQNNYNKALKSQEKMEAAKVVLDQSEKIAGDIKNDFNVTKNLVLSLIDNIPENTYIISMDYRDSNIQVDCISDSYNSAAQFIYNIKEDHDVFVDVFMPYVNEENEDYKYSLNIELGGEINETNQ